MLLGELIRIDLCSPVSGVGNARVMVDGERLVLQTGQIALLTNCRSPGVGLQPLLNSAPVETQSAYYRRHES
jgi:hypothetical protein